MKILYLNAGNETGGGMRHILQMIEALQQRESVTCVLGVCEKKRLYEKAQAIPVEVVHFKSKRKSSLSLLKQIAAFINEQQITHIHTHGPRANVYMKRIQNAIHVPWLSTIHSDPFADFKGRGIYGKLATTLHVQAIKKADHLISVCQTHSESLIAKGAHKEKLSVIHNGLLFTEQSEDRLHEETLRESHAITPTDFVMVQVARLEKVKGHLLAIQAFKNMTDKGFSAMHLFFIGGGTLLSILKKRVADLGLKKKIHFIGETEDVDSYYRLADLVILTSTSEGFPYVLLEAANWRKPVLATDVGDVGQLICSEDYGWLVPPRNSPAIQTAMEEAYFLKEMGLLQEKGNELHSFAKNNFSLDKCVQDVYNVYDSVIS